MGYADGLGDLQTQHSCVLLLDITENCNLECPTCFAAAAPGIGRFARLPHLLRSLDSAIEREGGRVDVLMLSGGEPTVHPDLLTVPNVVLTPHIASATLPTRLAMANLAADNLIAFFTGQPPLTPLNAAALASR